MAGPTDQTTKVLWAAWLTATPYALVSPGLRTRFGAMLQLKPLCSVDTKRPGADHTRYRPPASPRYPDSRQPYPRICGANSLFRIARFSKRLVGTRTRAPSGRLSSALDRRGDMRGCEQEQVTRRAVFAQRSPPGLRRNSRRRMLLDPNHRRDAYGSISTGADALNEHLEQDRPRSER
ncbi:hypothetical protein JCM10908_003858 [Rhodotorula pacifica]|uniref:uncharacterized protein n=1 Tax=Rhodotorula pacifica TaxID=1495444 RepID=UPI00317C2FCE